MTPLARVIAQRIRVAGPMTLADYMELCLMHPRHGYYASRDPFGAAGDFTTAPEISQIFGELCGLALAQAWMDQGRPAPFTLAEPGPGRGTGHHGRPGHTAPSRRIIGSNISGKRFFRRRPPGSQTLHRSAGVNPGRAAAGQAVRLGRQYP